MDPKFWSGAQIQKAQVPSIFVSSSKMHKNLPKNRTKTGKQFLESLGPDGTSWLLMPCIFHCSTGQIKNPYLFFLLSVLCFFCVFFFWGGRDLSRQRRRRPWRDGPLKHKQKQFLHRILRGHFVVKDLFHVSRICMLIHTIVLLLLHNGLSHLSLSLTNDTPFVCTKQSGFVDDSFVNTRTSCGGGPT